VPQIIIDHLQQVTHVPRKPIQLRHDESGTVLTTVSDRLPEFGTLIVRPAFHLTISRDDFTTESQTVATRLLRIETVAITVLLIGADSEVDDVRHDCKYLGRSVIFGR
jgi:hypothetical protein